mmetsp:Transcript_29580/g.67448  ORF Transcript_29580/g.67448 Transcript_29580/m.67448 type:complete len:192 (-) Transcript_29580:374-949(-)
MCLPCLQQCFKVTGMVMMFMGFGFFGLGVHAATAEQHWTTYQPCLPFARFDVQWVCSDYDSVCDACEERAACTCYQMPVDVTRSECASRTTVNATVCWSPAGTPVACFAGRRRTCTVDRVVDWGAIVGGSIFGVFLGPASVLFGRSLNGQPLVPYCLSRRRSQLCADVEEGQRAELDVEPVVVGGQQYMAE